ncbi:hypothetical protein [Halegenticoccus soli]|uniref:hypothetical protein n=1 Tax=Halegenticoccus soli TaxID=1985678 RepID=UPI000C6D94E5|nr:hypothetical protein [Halegenticoccus soli]
MGKKTEYCGRCAMSSVVDAVSSEQSDEERERRDPFRGSRIEIDEAELRAVSPAAWLAGLKSRLDTLATRLAYGR